MMWLLAMRMASGCPDWKVTNEPNCHPPMKASATRLRFLPISFVAADRQLIGGGDHKPLRRVVGGDTALTFQIALVLNCSKSSEPRSQARIGAGIRIGSLV